MLLVDSREEPAQFYFELPVKMSLFHSTLARTLLGSTLILLGLLTGSQSTSAAPEDPRVAWGRQRLVQALNDAGYVREAVNVETVVDRASPELPAVARRPEGFAVRTGPTSILVTGFDPAGVLYGCLEQAASIRREGELVAGIDLADAPAMDLRGPCILLMKLGSYNYAVSPDEFPFFYDRAQWIAWLDRMAELRFNSLTLWNGHPFAYFVPFDRFREAQEGMPPGLVERNREMLRWLVNEAARRNIRLIFEFYNIHTSVYFQRAHDLPDEVETPTPLLRDYTAYAVERFAREFPEIGYHITPGEALDLEHTANWVNDVLLPAMNRGGRRGPVWLRSWGIDLPHARQVAEANPEIWMERKFNVEMIADTRADPENREWAALTGRHVVNIHMAANLEPFRWSPPDYIRQCVLSAIDTGANGIHLYPRKSWRWPVGSEPGLPLLQWERDWSWYAAWARYAWNPHRNRSDDHAWWQARLAERFGSPEAADRLLQAMATGADVLPALQRLIWLGDDNHTVVAAGIRLMQLEQAQGIPFLDLPEVAQRIPAFLADLRGGRAPEEPTPMDFVDRQVRDAGRAARLAREAAASASRHRGEIAAWARDAQAVHLVARFYQQKLRAAMLRAQAEAPLSPTASDAFVEPLEQSVQIFGELAALLQHAYDSLSDVPAWNPVGLERVPYHWSDLVPLFERELTVYRDSLHAGPLPSNEPVLPGLAGKLYNDPGFKRLKEADSITSLDLRWEERGRNWSAEWRGFLIWPRDGDIMVRVQADAPVKVEIRGRLVIDSASSGFNHVTVSGKRGEAVPLHILFDHPGGSSSSYLQVQWHAGGSTFSPIPAEALRHSARDVHWVESALELSRL